MAEGARCIQAGVESRSSRQPSAADRARSRIISAANSPGCPLHLEACCNSPAIRLDEGEHAPVWGGEEVEVFTVCVAGTACAIRPYRVAPGEAHIATDPSVLAHGGDGIHMSVAVIHLIAGCGKWDMTITAADLNAIEGEEVPPVQCGNRAPRRFLLGRHSSNGEDSSAKECQNATRRPQSSSFHFGPPFVGLSFRDLGPSSSVARGRYAAHLPRHLSSSFTRTQVIGAGGDRIQVTNYLNHFPSHM